MNYEKKYHQELHSYEYQLYARQLILSQIQIEGQKRLKQSSILFIGAGGLASSALLYLIACGVGKIGLIDNDIIELSNLQRQVIYNTFMVGQMKVTAAKNQLQQINPKCNIKTYQSKLTSSNNFEVIHPYDIIIDCTDNFETRYIISDTCQLLHKIHIYGSIFEFEGQISVFNYRAGPSYQAISPLLRNNTINRCNTGGILGVVTGLIGMIQATEAIKAITGIHISLSGYVLIYNCIKISFKNLFIRKLNNYLDLLSIQDSNTNKIHPSYLQKKFISAQQLKNLIDTNTKNIYLIDIRDKIEYKIKHLYTAINIPLQKFKKIYNIQTLKQASMNKRIIIYCNNHARSQVASLILIKANIKHLILSNNF